MLNVLAIVDISYLRLENKDRKQTEKAVGISSLYH